MPAPPFAYTELEAAKAFGYKLSEWQMETLDNRARAIAHMFHDSFRQSYSSEQARKKAEGKASAGGGGSGGSTSYAAMRKAMGL